MERKSGSYWIKLRGVDCKGWQTAEYDSKNKWWFICGYEDSLEDDDLAKINENRIMSPDELE